MMPRKDPISDIPVINQQNSRHFLPALSIAIALISGPAALADSEEPVATKPLMTGEQVYKNVCIACHSPPGVGGAPALGNAEAWAPRIAQGMDTLTSHALTGFSG